MNYTNLRETNAEYTMRDLSADPMYIKRPRGTTRDVENMTSRA